MVYLVHFNPFEDYDKQPADVRYIAYQFLQQFGISLTLFFVLSGFLITLRYAESIRLEWSWYRGYIINRIARIYPMYFLITTLTFIAFAYDISYDFMGQYKVSSNSERLISQALNFSLLKGFSNSTKFTGVAQAWSLTVEECFYLIAPVFITGILLSSRRIFLYPILTILSGVAITALFSQLHFHGFLSSFSFLFTFTFFGRCVEFFVGMSLALYLKKNPGFLATISSKYKYTALGGLSILLCLIALTAVTLYIGGLPALTADFVINSLILPFLICVFYIGLMAEQNLITRILRSKPFEILGRSSYVFYLIHMGVIHIFIERHITSNELLIFVLLNVLAVILFKVVEEPCHRWIKSFGATTARVKPI